MSAPLRYASTRGDAPELDFADVLMTGLATDGGLYCPTEVPSLPDLTDLDDYASIARAVMSPFVDGSIELDGFADDVAAAYASFRHPDVAPLTDLGDNVHLLDLSWGPTLAFKDIALQLVGRLLDRELARRGDRVTVIGATSGDTGSAAIEALANRDGVDVVILHPDGRVSEVQRRQMTTVDAPNIRNVAVRGNFDDCQDLVKAAFADEELRAELGLAAVNSINWGRVMAQIVYYVTAARALAPDGGPVSFAVPTGNFGNVLAGWYAKRMGLDVDQLIVASNRNDVLTRVMESGALDAEAVVPSLSPSMDIQVSSNFERLLWEAGDRDGSAVAELLTTFRSEGRAEVPAAWMERIGAEFDFGRLDDEGTIAEIARVHDELGLLIEPHTAVGLEVGRRLRRDPSVPLVVLGTAHAAKFPDAVERATGVHPELPAFLSELHDRPEYVTIVDNDLGAVVGEMRALRTRRA